MKSYTVVYMLFFDYDIESFIPCEICGIRAVDIHHILARSQHKKLLKDINNLMALCRSCHEKYGDKKEFFEYLQRIHKEFMDFHKMMM